MVDCYKVEQRKSRKEYECQLCGLKILKGREYICESGRYEGKFFENKRHIHCNAIADAFFAEPWSENEYSEYEIWDYCRDYGCHACPKEKREECIDDIVNPFWCPNVIQLLLSGNEQRAALQSLQDNREDTP